jgi:hypothetical protein
MTLRRSEVDFRMMQVEPASRRWLEIYESESGSMLVPSYSVPTYNFVMMQAIL